VRPDPAHTHAHTHDCRTETRGGCVKRTRFTGVGCSWLDAAPPLAAGCRHHQARHRGTQPVHARHRLDSGGVRKEHPAPRPEGPRPMPTCRHINQAPESDFLHARVERCQRLAQYHLAPRKGYGPPNVRGTGTLVAVCTAANVAIVAGCAGGRHRRQHEPQLRPGLGHQVHRGVLKNVQQGEKHVPGLRKRVRRAGRAQHALPS
jgi:hypothetical protein